MAGSLIDLEQLLRSKQEKLTVEENFVMMTWKEKTLQQLTVGTCVGLAVALLATGNVKGLLRINLVGGAATLTGTWAYRRPIDSCIEQILCMDGSRMQRELPNILLKRNPNHAMTKKLISKHFYCENVFDDSTSDIPKSRWRFRNTFVESPPHPHTQRTEEAHESHDHDAKIGPQLNPLPMNNGFIAMENPFDCIFGVPPSVEEIRRPVSAKSTRKHDNRKQRRSQRRHHTHKDDHDYS